MAGQCRTTNSIWEALKPSNSGQGWVIGDQGILELIWSKRPIFPTSLVDLIEKTKDEQENVEICEEENEYENEIDFEFFEDNIY